MGPRLRGWPRSIKFHEGPALLEPSRTPDSFNNLGGVMSSMKLLSASVSNGLRNILKFEGAAFAASL